MKHDIVEILQTKEPKIYSEIMMILGAWGLDLKKDTNNAKAYVVVAEEAQIPIFKIWEENDGKRYGTTLPNPYLNIRKYIHVITRINELLGENPLRIR